MERFKLLKIVGDGSYGIVFKGIDTYTKENVAVKKMKRDFKSWEECMRLRELRSLRKLNHPNIVKLKEVIRENECLYFVFEYLEQNLYQIIKEKPEILTEQKIKSFIFQALSGIVHTHKKGFIHRDLKPENLMIRDEVLKIADYGLAREINSLGPLTEYVATRWYRAPEILLHSMNYSNPVDVFSLGAIMAEMFTLKPLFPGHNESDMIMKIASIVGKPTMESWAEGYQLAKNLGISFPENSTINIGKIIPKASCEALDLISKMLTLNPKQRITAAECLAHPFFSDVDSSTSKGLPYPVFSIQSETTKSKGAINPDSFNGLVNNYESNRSSSIERVPQRLSNKVVLPSLNLKPHFHIKQSSGYNDSENTSVSTTKASKVSLLKLNEKKSDNKQLPPLSFENQNQLEKTQNISLRMIDINKKFELPNELKKPAGYYNVPYLLPLKIKQPQKHRFNFLQTIENN